MALAAVLAASCGQQGRTAVPAINLSNLDTTVAPGTNFYDYATAGWRRNNPLKPEYSRYGAFDILAENNEIRLNEMFSALASKRTKPGTEARKIADLYTMGLDSVRLNAEGAAPVLKYLGELESVTDLESFAAASGRLARMGLGNGIFGAYVGADMKNSDENILYVGESGLALRNRDFYLLPEHAAIREGYKAFLEKVFTLAGHDDAGAAAADAFEVEMAIAVPYWSMERQRDIEAQYNPMSSSAMYAAWPELHLEAYMAEAGIPDQKILCVEQPDYLGAVNALLPGMAPSKLRHYLQATVLSDASARLSDDFAEARFDFFSRQMAGVQEQKPRWKRSMAFASAVLGEAVGKLYVEKYFPEQDKARMLEIVKNIQASLGEHIAALEWMSEETKAKALEKLSAFTIKIGYPDEWKDYSSLETDPSLSYLDNCVRASEWHVADNISKLGRPVDRQEWGMTPQTVNAYYNPTTNEICFPAGILQPPSSTPTPPTPSTTVP